MDRRYLRSHSVTAVEDLCSIVRCVVEQTWPSAPLVAADRAISADNADQVQPTPPIGIRMQNSHARDTAAGTIPQQISRRLRFWVLGR